MNQDPSARRKFIEQALMLSGAAILTGCKETSSAAISTASLASTGSKSTINAPDLFINVRDFGAKGDWNGTHGTDDSEAIQAAVNACPSGGSVYFPPGKYRLKTEIRVTKPMNILGSGQGSPYSDTGSFVIQTNTSARAFCLVADPGNYAFGQYGIIGVHFKDLAILGRSNESPSICGVGVDTSINGGDFHIRECSFTQVSIRYFTVGIDFTGIAYLNHWFGGTYSHCGTGIKIARGAASDLGGQSRLFGVTFVLNSGPCVSLNEDTLGGDFAFFGCTLSESQYGIRANQGAQLSVIGCDFESNHKSGSGAGIYISITSDNPNTSGPKFINGNKFITNDADIWIDKKTTAFAGGAFHWPMAIDANDFQSALALKITTPPGHVGINSAAFVVGASNSGPANGAMAPTQISTQFNGTFEAKRRITRRYQISSTWASGGLVDALPIGMVLQTVRIYLTAQATAYTAVQLGHQSNGNAYAFFNGNTQPLNTWITYTSVLGDVVDQTNCNLVLGGSTGWRGMAGVIEIDGYLP